VHNRCVYDEYRGNWDDEPIGTVDSPSRRRWNHGRNNYFAVMLGMIGLFVTIGAMSSPTPIRLVGALCVLASPLAITFSDRAAKRSSDGARRAPLQTELTWLAVAVVMAAGGLVAFALS
jgi:hypothetical protein